MNNNYLEKLEFNKIIEMLTSFCCTYKGTEYCLQLKPSNDHTSVKQLLEETNEAINLSYKNTTPDFYDFYDITLELKKLESNSFHKN